MRLLASLLVLLLITQLGLPQTPVPRGVHQAEQADAQAQQNVPPPLQRAPAVDMAKLQREANELASLAASIPPAIDKTTRGMLPNDLPEKLKRIEKLAKRLRSELNP